MSFLAYAPIIISTLSLCLALYSALSTYYEKHIKTKIYLRWAAQFTDQITVCLLISNMSSRPSTITNVKLKTFKDTYEEATFFPVLLAENADLKAYSDSTPLNIPPRSAKTFVISFQNIQAYYLNERFITLRYTVDDVAFERSEELKVKLDFGQFQKALQYRMN